MFKQYVNNKIVIIIDYKFLFIERYDIYDISVFLLDIYCIDVVKNIKLKKNGGCWEEI